MSLLSRKIDLNIYFSIIRLYSFARQNHYDILKIKKNCSDKDIKDAFIRLSKEFHPDKNKSPRAQETFVRIVEAYNTLGKPSSRAEYDRTREYSSSQQIYRNNPYQPRYEASSNYYSRPRERTHSYAHEEKKEQKRQYNENTSFYGVPGVQRKPNFVIVIILFGIAIMGTYLQYIVISHSYYTHQRQMMEESQKNAAELRKVRERAMASTNEVQQFVLERIVTGSNPNVATATLGHALANEKK